MSDFVNPGWAWYVAGLTILSLVFCVFILVVASKRKVMASDNTTGHIWDEDLRELNNPRPGKPRQTPPPGWAAPRVC